MVVDVTQHLLLDVCGLNVNAEQCKRFIKVILSLHYDRYCWAVII